ncbi:hypothetical protein CAOG_06146 [Capsaspora owczarzaki ATCC 30864]|uniref:AAA+ ATPase domain-containing protein n=1 Tax=Capsaspora owczarzaki (strain ATCC 30864) TaxID=595528 RepID=A0A0D2X4A6_CAPO3|nr:hypothetical protein CAOG_06146 [Capsaspora owczarzaki ATCC 30864]KJE95724.1 hypothetical protein CAOG_006146 [Capsaspora owczarzaki ATCC 30864]|eukprot:XP_004345736.1 hypothetical protein CAOG_06146 [Capsaspora owczarzaki ATCC 30864]
MGDRVDNVCRITRQDVDATSGVELPAEISDRANVITVEHPLELVPRSLALHLLDNITTAVNAPANAYLTGSGGVGKSTVLFILLVRALDYTARQLRQPPESPQRPLFVLYVASTASIARLRPDPAAASLCRILEMLNRPLLNLPQYADLLALLRPAIAPIRAHGVALAAWNAVCDYCAATTTFCSLFILDQWNAMFDPAVVVAGLPQDHPLQSLGFMGARFGVSMFVAAVSSSFDPLDAARGVFRDAEAHACKQMVRPLSHAETQVLQQTWLSRNPPVRISDNIMADLHRITGGIPRLCELFGSRPFASVEDAEFRNVASLLQVPMVL